MLTSLIYFPARKELYYIEDDSVFLEINGKLQKIASPLIKNRSIVYVNNRVDDIARNKLKLAGYELIDDSDGIVGWTDALLKCLRGEYYACIFHSPQIRDVLLGSMIDKFPDGHMFDWNGNKIIWPQKGRIPQVFFCLGSVSNELLSCLT